MAQMKCKFLFVSEDDQEVIGAKLELLDTRVEQWALSNKKELFLSLISQRSLQYASETPSNVQF